MRLRRGQAIRPQAPTKTPPASHLLSKQLIDKSCTSKYISAGPYIFSLPLFKPLKKPPSLQYADQVRFPAPAWPRPHCIIKWPRTGKGHTRAASWHSRPNRVRTLTGKEIELDIEPDYKVNHPPASMHFRLLPARNHFTFRLKHTYEPRYILTIRMCICWYERFLQVSRIKERVEEKEGIPPVQQRLIFGGKQM